jgi:putative ABC transport system permease protein
MNGLALDFRYVLRSLRRSPTVSAVVVVSLSVGMAMITIFFSFLNTIVLRPLPYRDAARIRMVWKSTRTSNEVIAELSASAKSLQRVAAVVSYGGSIGDDPRIVLLALVDSGFFPLLMPQPELGVLPASGDVHQGAPILVISDALWRRRFNATPDIIGRVITIGGQRRTIVAVLPPSFTIPYISEAWAPLTRSGRDPDEPIGLLFVKLAPGATWSDAERELQLVSSRQQGAYHPEDRSMPRLRLLSEMVGRDRGPGQDIRLVVLVLGAAACMLLVVCTNVALLMMVRGERRRTELVIRAAIGASRWQLIRQQVIECVCLAVTAAVLALGMTYWGIFLILSIYFPANYAYPGWMHFGLDWRVAMFGAALTLLTIMICGMWPARVGTRLNLQLALRADAESTLTGRDPTRSGHLPVVLQLALGLPLFLGKLCKSDS